MNITEIVVAVIGLLGVICTTLLAPYLKNKLGASKLEKLNIFCKTFVYAAEQLIGSGNGEAKKEKVKMWLQASGIDVDLDIVNSAIEAQVKEMNIAMKKI